MSHFLMPSTPIFGHVTPMLAIGRELVGRGHHVTVLTGRKYRSAVESRGLSFLPLPAEIDYDDAQLDGWLPDREQYHGLAAGRYDIIGLFIRPLGAQHRAFAAAMATGRFDAVVGETAFLGLLPTLLTRSAAERVPIVGVSATPLSLISVDCAPFGSGLDPGDSAHTRRRNRLINAVLQRGPLKPIQTALDDALSLLGLPRGAANYFDQAVRFDLTFQLSVPSLEYPRRELPPTVRFVGPLRYELMANAPVPPWWGDLDGSRPVVHVTQGTMANVDLAKLLSPTICGLAGEDVLVVAATGGRPVEQLLRLVGGRLPDNARVAEFLPYHELLPRTQVMVTNGGFGGVQHALAHGVPLVVAGATEDKPEVAGRVAWSGTGVNVGTGSPSPTRVRRAVRTVLGDPRYRLAAERVQRHIVAQGDPLNTIGDTLASLTTIRAAVGQTSQTPSLSSSSRAGN